MPFGSELTSAARQDRSQRLIVGLGNPGERYIGTRHNAGFMVVDALAREGQAQPWVLGSRSLLSSMELEGCPVLLAKPLTFMNLSGQAVQLLVAEYGLEVKDALVILDDLNLPFGTIRVRTGGSAGGHNGLQSVLRMLGSEDVTRLRLGISEENMPADKAEFVLSRFPPDKWPCLDEMIVRAGSAVKMILREGVAKTMSVFNAH